MEDLRQQTIAYEMALLAKRNRELEQKLLNANETIKELERCVSSLNRQIDNLLEKKEAEAKSAISQECDIDLIRGDRVVITWVREDCKSHVVGMVYEVATITSKPLSDRDGDAYYNLGVKTFDADGNIRSGTGSVLSIKSKNAHWRKVPDGTPLSIRVRVVDKKNQYSDAYHYEFKNLYKQEITD